MKEIHIDSVDSFNSELVKFLKFSVTSWDELYLNQKWKPEHVKTKVDIDYFIETVIKIIPKCVRNNFLLGYFSIKTDQFNQIIKASSQLEFLSFNCCKLIFDENLNFSLDDSKNSSDYKIRVIALTGWGKGFNEGTVDEKGFKHFIETISKCSLKTSLKQLSLMWWNLSKETANTYLEEFNIEHISIWA